MGHLNNPAGRLYKILKEGQSISKNKNAKEAWAQLLDVPPDDIPLLLRRIGRVIELPSAIREGIEEHPDASSELHLKWMPQVEKALSNLNLGQNWSNVINHIDKAALYGLEVCDHELSRYKPDVEVEEKDVHEIHEDVRALIEDIIQSDLPGDLREHLLNHLRQLDQALQEFRIAGSAPIMHSVEATIGSTVLNQKVAKRANKTEHGKRFWKIISRIALIFSLGAHGTAIGEHIPNLLAEPDVAVVEEQVESPELTDEAETEPCDPEDQPSNSGS